MPHQAEITEKLKTITLPLEAVHHLDPLIERIGDAHFVLLGEASHGTSEYYLWRAYITQRLIEEKGFSFIAVEGDWPDCYEINRYIKGYNNVDEHARNVLHAFDRWPSWMWANWEIVALVEWLKKYNQDKKDDNKTGFYGLDVYSLWESMEAIITYLEKTDSESLAMAKRAYQCFEPYNKDIYSYARSSSFMSSGCEDEVVNMLLELRKKAKQYKEDPEEHFNAEQNALVAVNAERYYRNMVKGGAHTWNIRDRHMAETLDRLVKLHGEGAKAIIWEHNTHIGDARATDMADDGMVNVGQLVREKYGENDVVLVGFGSHRGTVIAGDEWGAPMEVMKVPEAREKTWEDILHKSGETDKLIILDTVKTDPDWLRERGHRAIGVVYHPDRERFGNYVPTVLPERYDAFIYIDETKALHPLHMKDRMDTHEPPETYPFGM